MTFTEILTFVVVAALLVMSPGPNGVLIAKTVPTSGRAAGFANIAGFIAAFYVHGALSILGISVVLLQSALLFSVLKFAGAGYLCWIGIRALMDALRRDSAPLNVLPARRRRTLLRAGVEGFLTNALNPKVSLFYLAAFPQFIATGTASAGSDFFLVFLHSAPNAIWFGAMVLLFARLTGAAKRPAFQRWLKGITGAVFVGFGVKLATVRAVG